MGCTTSQGKKPFDLHAFKPSSTPKNEISLMRLTEELLKALRQLGATAHHEEQIIANNLRLESRQDEYGYLMEIAREQIEVLNLEGGIFTICSELIGHLVILTNC